MIKQKFGGLKRFLERHPDVFHLGSDHPFNPKVNLVPEKNPVSSSSNAPQKEHGQVCVCVSALSE
jgi:hypothetical protein